MGEIVAIHITPEGGAEPVSVPSVRAAAGRGLEGDRYFLGTGTYSKKDDGSRQVTLIESEALEALQRDYGLSLSPAGSRRNLLTRGVALNHLVGRRFRVGEVLMEGVRLCEPCGHLEQLTGRPVRAGLVHRGGLRARVLSDGRIAPGDTISLVPESTGQDL